MKILESFNNFKPDLIVLGHADMSFKTNARNFKNNSSLKICQWFLDPLSKFGPDHINNRKRILDKIDLLDATFLTTDLNLLVLNT